MLRIDHLRAAASVPLVGPRPDTSRASPTLLTFAHPAGAQRAHPRITRHLSDRERARASVPCRFRRKVVTPLLSAKRCLRPRRSCRIPRLLEENPTRRRFTALSRPQESPIGRHSSPWARPRPRGVATGEVVAEPSPPAASASWCPQPPRATGPSAATS